MSPPREERKRPSCLVWDKIRASDHVISLLMLTAIEGLFAIYDRRMAMKLGSGSHNAGITLTSIEAIAGVSANRTPFDGKLSSVAIELDLMNPVRTHGRLVNEVASCGAMKPIWPLKRDMAAKGVGQIGVGRAK